MPIDPSIISGAFNQNQGVSPNALLGIMQFAQQEQDRRRELAKQNQLAAILSNPANYGPDKQLTQNALRQASSVDPETGVKLQDQTARARIQSLQANAMMSEQGQRKFDISTTLAATAVDAYDDEIAAGKTPDQAMAAFRKARNEAADNLGGVLGNEDVDKIKAQPGDINTARALAGFNKEWTTRQTEKSRESFEEKREKASDTREAARESETDRRLTDQEAAEAARAKDADARVEKGQWQILTDPKTNTQYRYNAATGQATTLDMKPYTPQGAQKMGGGTQRSGLAMYMQKYMQDNPNATAADLARASGIYGRTLASIGTDVKADSASLTNITKMSDAAAAFEDTAMKNFETAMSEAPKAVPNLGPFLNRWVEKGETMFGDTDVPKYVAALLTGANEYAKVMAGSTGSQGSTVDSRREAAEIFSQYFNTGQIKGVIDIAHRDMENKKASYASKRDEIKGRISGEANPDEKPSDRPSPGPKRMKYDADGNLVPQ